MYGRIPANVQANFFYGNVMYGGTITNLSKNGMYIDTTQCLPRKSKFDVLILSNYWVLEIPAKVSRLVKTGNTYNGMGVELLNQPKKYLEFVTYLKTKGLGIPLTISDETLKQSIKCQRTFECLTDRHLCLIDRPVNGKGLFIKEKVSNAEHCQYVESSENAFICYCPTRYEIYKRYNL